MNKKELIEENKTLQGRVDRYQENRDRYNKLKDILIEKLGISLIEKFGLLFELYGFVKVKKQGKGYLFEYPIRNGWATINSETLEEGINRLLNF